MYLFLSISPSLPLPLSGYHKIQECIPVGCVPPARRSYLPGPGGCTWSGGVYLVPWGVYLVRGGVPGLGGVCLARGVCLAQGGGVPGPRGGTWSEGVCVPGTTGGVPGLGRCTWSHGGVYLARGGCAWSQGDTWSRGYLVRGVCAWSQRGGVYLVPGGCTWSGTPPVNRMTNRCKNITLPQTSFAGGNKDMLVMSLKVHENILPMVLCYFKPLLET